MTATIEGAAPTPRSELPSSFGASPLDRSGDSIAAIFEDQVRLNPQRIAVKTNQISLTYGALNRDANRLARTIDERAPDQRPLAILLEHDAPAIVALLAALKAAKIFVLLDPALPPTRLAQIVNDSGGQLIVTNDRCEKIAAPLAKPAGSLINLDHLSEAINDDNLERLVDPDSTAYILYTSGSTGVPKGVIRTHRNDLHNIRHHTRSLGFNAADRMTLLGSYSTGQGIQDVFDALLNGATLLPRDLKATGFADLADWLARENITVYHSAATLFRRFTSELDDGRVLADLRVIRLGSEAVSWKDVASYKAHFADTCVLSCELSCSEANTISQWLVDKRTPIGTTVPVGYALTDKEISIVDESGLPVAAGESGEIAVRSRYLSPGYWNRPDLTAQAFSAADAGTRIYRSGDLGRLSADGCLEHLGRKDSRVKIRGYRVECREVELALLNLDAVDQAFVTAGEDPRGETELIAYVVGHRGSALTVGALRAELSRQLPDYMVPARLMFLDTLPLTPTGKIDRPALPSAPAARPLLDIGYQAPRNELEATIAALCREILQRADIGVHDNLFEMGGHSLAAMQIVARVMKTFQVEVQLARFL